MNLYIPTIFVSLFLLTTPIFSMEIDTCKDTEEILEQISPLLPVTISREAFFAQKTICLAAAVKKFCAEHTTILAITGATIICIAAYNLIPSVQQTVKHALGIKSKTHKTP